MAGERFLGFYEYLELVEGRREGGRVRQHVVANLGRLDELVAGGRRFRLRTVTSDGLRLMLLAVQLGRVCCWRHLYLATEGAFRQCKLMTRSRSLFVALALGSRCLLART